MPSLDSLVAYYKERGWKLLRLVMKDRAGVIVLVNPEKPELIPPEAPTVTGISISLKDPKVTPPGD